MSLPDSVRSVLPQDAADTWETIGPALPDQLYLAGGTALAAHLGHRVSRDLDFFYHEDAVDLEEVRKALEGLGHFAVTDGSSGTLNGVFSATRLQFLHADEGEPQRRIEAPTRVGDINVAAISDILAMKLAAVGGRGELRDYFDLMAIDQGPYPIEAGLALFLERYGGRDDPSALDPIVRALGYLDDVDDDEQLPERKAVIATYWRRRQPQVLASLAQFRV